MNIEMFIKKIYVDKIIDGLILDEIMNVIMGFVFCFEGMLLDVDVVCDVVVKVKVKWFDENL
jgi:hypothetical protein